MNWWQSLCVGVAQSFFAGLTTAKPSVKTKIKPIALQIFQNIRLAFYDDPDFQ